MNHAPRLVWLLSLALLPALGCVQVRASQMETLPPDAELTTASAQGKYAELLATLEVPEDAQRYGPFTDYGLWRQSHYMGAHNLPQGYWVYAVPTWYIWGRLAAQPVAPSVTVVQPQPPVQPIAAPSLPTPPAPPAPAPPPPPARACVADATRCCMPDGRLVVPGGCQPSYPSHVQGGMKRGADGRCEPVRCSLKCLTHDTRIATPRGAVAVSALSVGELVFTRDAAGRRVSAPVLRVEPRPVGPEGHSVLELTLSDGRRLLASAGHPTADGATLGALRVGRRLDGATVQSVRAVPYLGAATWDLLPAGATGTYWADGVLLGSTLSAPSRAARAAR